MYKTTLSGQVWRFDSLKTLMAKASPARSGDALAGVIARAPRCRVAMGWYTPLLALSFAARRLGGYLWFRKTASSRERAPADPQLRIVS